MSGSHRFYKDKNTSASDSEITYLLAKDTSDNRAYRLCLHFKSAKELLGFWDFCEQTIQKKIHVFTNIVLNCFSISGQKDLDTWFDAFKKEDILQLFFNNDLEGITKILGGSNDETKEIPSEQKRVMANKLKKKFQTIHHDTEQRGDVFDFMTHKPIYFSSDPKERLISTLRWHSYKQSPDYYERFDSIKYEAMIAKEQYLLVRQEIGCADSRFDMEKLESPYVGGRDKYFIPPKNFNLVRTIIAPPELSKHIENFPDPDIKPSNCNIM